MTDLADHRTPDEKAMADRMARRAQVVMLGRCKNCDRLVSFTYRGMCRVCDKRFHPEDYDDEPPRCGWCGAYKGTVDPNEPCATSADPYTGEEVSIGPHQFVDIAEDTE